MVKPRRLAHNVCMRFAAIRPTPTTARACGATVLLATMTLLTGCDQLGIDTPAKQAARREADGKAIGAGCRHTQRSLEDCYAAHPKASKAAIFAGWREMDEYMRENDIAPVPASRRAPEPGEPREEVVETTTPAPAAVGAPAAAPAGTTSAAPAGAPAPSAAGATVARPAGAVPAGVPPGAPPSTPPSGSIVPPLGPVTAPSNAR